jgi:hypothetical protein
VKLDERRRLNEAERGVLAALLLPEFPGVAELRAQIPEAWVVGRCDCGCPSVDIEVPTTVAPSPVQTVSRLAPVEGRVTPAAEELGDIILFVDDGYMSYLEYVSYDDPSAPEWPSLDRVTVTQLDR